MNIKAVLAVMAGLIVTTSVNTVFAQSFAKQRDTSSTGSTTTIEKEGVIKVTSGETVLLDAKKYNLPKTTSRYKWHQISGPKIRLVNRYTPTAYFVAPRVTSEEVAEIVLQLIVNDNVGRQYHFNQQIFVLPPQPHEPPELVSQRNDNEILIPAEYHPLGNEITAVIHIPEDASAENPVPGCAIIHGSGGLFREEEPGQMCSQQIEPVYQALSDQLLAQGVATILPSSFYSRDNRFCEDNEDDYIQYAGAPFFNGNDPVTRDDSYKIRRVAVRTMDMLATMNFFCDLNEVDCNRSCMVGTSNGATSIMAYTAQSLPKDLLEFMDDDKRPFEYNSTHQKRNTAFANFPALTVSPITLTYNLNHRPLPKFAQLVSPGCTMRDMVPDIEPGNENLPFTPQEVYYPAGDTELTFEVGTADSVPKECYEDAPNGEGLREVQARYFEQETAIQPADSRYIIEVHQQGPHSLLSDDDYSEAILNRLDDLILSHLAP